MIGYMVRMDQRRRIKKVFGSKPEGSRRSGRPRLRWLEDVDKYLREMKVKILRQKTVDTEEWESVITEAKAARVP
jgi:predicted metal-binding protein